MDLNNDITAPRAAKNRGAALKGIISFAVAFALCSPHTAAFAETDNIDAEADGLQKTVEETAEEYNRATERVEEINKQIEDNEAQISELDDKIDDYRDMCSSSMVDLYKLRRDGAGIMSVILASEDLSTFLNGFYYLNRMQESANANLARLSSLLQEREETQKELESAKADAESEQEKAERAAALAAYQREEAQKAAEEKAKQDAQALQEAEEAEGSSSGGSSPSLDGADWSQDKATFVSSWAGRLDAYLAGSPLSGHGKTFAAAAWDAGIDPRFSAAISEVESSKGAACFYPYNAWGWGSVSWSSWEESIPAHAMGLARGYGYTVTIEGAQKYCANWQFWYNRVSEEMAKI